MVEQHFSFVKSPKVVGAIYLKNPERLAALAYVFLMALVYSLIQLRARRALKGQDNPLLIYDNRNTFEPTGRSVLDPFVNMTVAYVDGKRVLPSNLKSSPTCPLASWVLRATLPLLDSSVTDSIKTHSSKFLAKHAKGCGI
ncbi:MAG: hypothetical protein AB1497_07920 [Bacillota bacterium]